MDESHTDKKETASKRKADKRKKKIQQLQEFISRFVFKSSFPLLQSQDGHCHSSEKG